MSDSAPSVVEDAAERGTVEVDEARLAEVAEELILGGDSQAIALLDPAGRIAGWNRWAEKLTGFSAKQAMGRVFTVLLGLLPSEDETPPVVSGFQKLLRADGTLLPVKLYATSGKTSQFEGCAVLFRHASPVRAIGVALDRVQSRLAEAQNLARMGTWGWDAKTGRVWWSTETYRLFGVDPSVTPTYEMFLSMVHPEDRDALMARAHGSGDTNGYATDFRITRPDGKILWVHSRSRPLLDENGDFAGLEGIDLDITERKQNEESLRALQQSLEEAQGISRLGSWICYLDNKPSWWSPEIYRLMALDPNTIGSTARFLEAVHPADRDLMTELLYGMKSGALEAVTADTRIVRGDGEVRWMMVRAEPRADENGTVVRLEGTMQDITERKNAEEALRERESLLRQISESTDEIFWVRETGKAAFIFMSPGFERVFGTPVSKLLNDPWSWMRQVHPEDRARTKTVLRAVRSDQGKPVPGGEYRIVRPDGEVRWILVSGESVVRDEQGRVYRAVGTAHDITERRRSEQALRESEQHLRAVVECSVDGIVLLDDEGRYVEANPAACEMLGYTREEFLRLGMVDVVPQGEAAGFQENWRKFRELGSFQGRRRLMRRDGTVIEVESHRVANILPGLHLSVLHDVTAAVTAEESRRLLEQQLVEAQKLDAVGRLAGGVAHDFNNLLTVINGYSDLMLSQMEQEDRNRDAVEAIRHAGSRAASLTQQLLAFGRKQRLNAVPLNVNDVLVQASRMLERLIGEDILVEVHPGRSLGMVKADPSHLEQVVVNLALNARDAMPMGGLLRLETVELDVPEPPEPGCAPGRYIRLRVSDTGVGIGEDVQGQIFEPFFTTKKLGKGTGLGLSVVHGVVRQSGGYIRFRSKPGNGSTFDVFLPVVTECPTAEPEVVEGAVGPGGRETILLVEDESAVRDVIATMLRSAGYQVKEASGATEALAEAGKQKIDLLVSDVIMPGMGGPQLAEMLRAHDPCLKVLYVSGYAQDATGQRGLLRSGDDLLQKPFSPADLLRRVRGVLEVREEDRESGWNI